MRKKHVIELNMIKHKRALAAAGLVVAAAAAVTIGLAVASDPGSETQLPADKNLRPITASSVTSSGDQKSCCSGDKAKPAAKKESCCGGGEAGATGTGGATAAAGNQKPLRAIAVNNGSLGTTGYGVYLGSFDKTGTGSPAGGAGAAPVFAGGKAVATVVDVPYSAAANPNGPFTVEFWANPSAAVPAYSAAVSPLSAIQGGPSAKERSGWIFYQADGRWELRLGGKSGYVVTNLLGGAVSVGAWQQVVGVYDGTSASLYVNGEQVGSSSPTSAFSPNTTSPIRVGATGFDNRPFAGSVDQVVFYGEALSAAQIKEHYTSGLGGQSAAYAQLVKNANPLIYLPLNEAAYAPLPQIAAAGGCSGSCGGGAEKGSAAASQKAGGCCGGDKTSGESASAGAKPGDKPYPLTTCLVTGDPLGGMGQPYVFSYQGQEIKLCCKGCLKKFEADPATYLKKLTHT
jgi:YHS domain-containing protein